jgi:hypothetical protein
MGFVATFSITTLSINDIQHEWHSVQQHFVSGAEWCCAESYNAECHVVTKSEVNDCDKH